jgi:hypothetical protein
MAKKKPRAGKKGKGFAVGSKLKVKLNDGSIVDATVRALGNDGEHKLQIDYGHKKTALIQMWQVLR